jgi:UDP-2,3-diacylglucosamine hydrolase
VTRWFASDLHLDPSTPDIAARFLRFLAGPVRGAHSLFLLGDLFEAWVGDDDPEPAHREVIASIGALARAGTLVYVMRGNRDFLIGERFCSDSGAILLEDPAIITVAGAPAVLSHGDGLCIDDRAYQKLRALVRDERVRADFARLPLEARRRLATEARAGSREHLATAVDYITDVNQTAVETLMREAGAGLMIHGHTHRPGIHRFESDSLSRTRIVLGAWHDQAMVLRSDATGYQLVPCPV